MTKDWAYRVIKGGRTQLQAWLQDSIQALQTELVTTTDNVIRDFRPNERGIRIWGGRVITSDTDWKYVNVRRLFIYLEHSIDKSTQWSVFEPNNEALWANIRQTISDFLLVTWRTGALMGTKPEEASG